MVEYRRAKTKDNDFIFSLVKEWLHDYSEQTVTVSKISKKKFFSKPAIRYIIGDNFGFVQLLPNNEIGYYLDPKFQNKGLGTKAVKEIIKKHPRPFYYVTISNKNKSSLKLAKKCGFVPKGQILVLESK